MITKIIFTIVGLLSKCKVNSVTFVSFFIVYDTESYMFDIKKVCNLFNYSMHSLKLFSK